MATATGFSQATIVAMIIACAGCVLAFGYSLAALRRTHKSQHALSTQAPSTSFVSSLMQGDPYTIAADTPVREVMRQLIEYKVSGMPLVDSSGKPLGFVSDGDIMRYLAKAHPSVINMASLVALANSSTFDERLRELLDLPASVIATESTVTVNENASLDEVFSLLAQHKLKKVPVLRDGKIVGMLGRSDVIRYAMEQALEE